LAEALVRKICKALALFLALLPLAACTTVMTVHPIGQSNGAIADARLVGHWQVVEQSNAAADAAEDAAPEAGYVFILEQENSPALQVLLVAPEGENEWWTFEIVTGNAGGNLMMNARPILANGESVPDDEVPLPEGYFPLRYSVEPDGSVRVYTWGDLQRIADAVRNGDVAGTVAEAGGGTDVRITAAPQELDAYFSAVAAELLTEHVMTLTPIE
jgi:hypothetical protein